MDAYKQVGEDLTHANCVILTKKVLWQICGPREAKLGERQSVVEARVLEEKATMN